MRRSIARAATIAPLVASLIAPAAWGGPTAPLPSDTRARAELDYLITPRASLPTARVTRSDDGRELRLENGLVRRTFRLSPETTGAPGPSAASVATISFEELRFGRELVRAVRPEAWIVVDGERYPIGGLEPQPNHAFLRPEWLDAMAPPEGAFRLVDVTVEEPRARFHGPSAAWPPAGVHLTLHFEAPPSTRAAGIVARVHYELYDGLPALSKWLEVENRSERAVVLDAFAAEVLAVVEDESWVELRDGVTYPAPTSLHVETDYSFGGMTPRNASAHAVHWRPDPDYASQVNYARRTPCLLEVSPALGPAARLAPGATFTSFRVFELVHDSTDRERRGLALRRMYRTVAPWVTENPLMHHMRLSDPDEVRRAVRDAAEVGFEMLILSFGSGFDIESEDAEYIEGWRDIADEARELGVEVGGYSLLASRSIGPETDVVMPPGRTPIFGHAPCLESEWGERYFARLRAFYGRTGFRMLEHDGNYPGDPCASGGHPGHRELADSRWTQWSAISSFYRWCRGEGIYLNVPDYYFLTGSSKTGMGYREVNWSLPRDEQVIHTRQNIFDGTWTKTPSMGWMFVPLTEYHGGGEAATIEPLDRHRDHYRRMLRSNLALGVQACYRGPRLFDTDATRELVRNEVDWFKRYRRILEADLVHGRRADGRNVDWMLHVDPTPAPDDPIRGMLVAFHPEDELIETTLDVDLYYTGLTDVARVSVEEGPPVELKLDRDYGVEITLEIPARGMSWAVIR